MSDDEYDFNRALALSASEQSEQEAIELRRVLQESAALHRQTSRPRPRSASRSKPYAMTFASTPSRNIKGTSWGPPEDEDFQLQKVLRQSAMMHQPIAKPRPTPKGKPRAIDFARDTPRESKGKSVQNDEMGGLHPIQGGLCFHDQVLKFEIPGNGDCQFAAIAKNMRTANIGYPNANVTDFRDLVAVFIEGVTDQKINDLWLQNRNDNRDRPGLSETPGRPNFDEDIPTDWKRVQIAAAIRRLGNVYWGDSFTLNVLCVMLNIRVLVLTNLAENYRDWDREKQDWDVCVAQLEGPPNAHIVIPLIMSNGVHFDSAALIRIDGRPLWALDLRNHRHHQILETQCRSQHAFPDFLEVRSQRGA